MPANAKKLSPLQALEIRESYGCSNITQRELAQRYGVSQNLVWRIVHNKAWKDVSEAKFKRAQLLLDMYW